MIQKIVRWARLAGALALATLAVAAPLAGQATRQELVARAQNEFDPARRVQLLTSALDPSQGPPDSSWVLATQELAQTLIVEGKESLATTWLRWAVRQAPIEPDTVKFLPSVVAAVREAKRAVGAAQTAQDATAVTSWMWAAPGSAVDEGILRISPGSTPSLAIEVEGIGAIPVGTDVSLRSGSYALSASAPQHTGARSTREILPGVTTVVEFRLAATGIKPDQPVATAKKKSKVPYIAAGVGVVAAVCLLAICKGEDEEPTGSISVTFPE